MNAFVPALAVSVLLLAGAPALAEQRTLDLPAFDKANIETSIRAQIVIGERPIMQIKGFSFVKKLLQRLGSWAVAIASRTRVPDAPSGFRAIHREAALRLCVFNDYTYTLETIIQAGRKNIPVTSVPVRTSPPA